MGRRTRQQEMHGAYYHVFNRGHNKQPVFHDDTDRLRFMELLSASRARTRVRIFNYCLMDNHYHLLLGLAEDPDGSLRPDSIGVFIKIVAQTYAQYFNRRYDRLGALWGNRFRTRAVGSPASLLATGFYIELNPLKAGLVTHPSQNRFSSYAHYAGHRHDPLVTDNPMTIEAPAAGGGGRMPGEYYERLILEWHAERERHDAQLRKLGIVGWRYARGRPVGSRSSVKEKSILLAT